MVCDLLTLPRPTVVAARELIAKETGIPAAHVLIAATHAHTGPVVARESSRDDLDGGTSEAGQRYTQSLPALIARSVALANERLSAAHLAAAHGRSSSWPSTDAFGWRTGRSVWNPPKLDPKIVAPAGPHDPGVGVLLIESLEEKPRPLAAFVNYAMHPDTTGGVAISADFPGALARRMAEIKGGEGMLTMFANGACGNLNHRNVWWADPQKGPGETARLGTILAGAVCATWPSLAPVGPVVCRCAARSCSSRCPRFRQPSWRKRGN